MKTKIILLASLFGMASCIKHEVVPKPEEKVDLKIYFKGTIGGATIEFTENVQGYAAVTNKSLSILPAPSPSSATYYCEFSSSQSSRSATIGLGELSWASSGSTTSPAETDFNAFFNNNLNPLFAGSASVAGFLFKFRDNNGYVWTSKLTPYHLDQDIVFNNVVQEKDATDNYSKFTALFDTWIYRSYLVPDPLPATTSTLQTDSLHVQNAKFTGWFSQKN